STCSLYEGVRPGANCKRTVPRAYSIVEEDDAGPRTFPCLVLRDGLLTSCPIAVHRGPDSPVVCKPPTRKRGHRGSLKQEPGVPPAIAQGTTEAVHTAEAGVLLEGRLCYEPALFLCL